MNPRPSPTHIRKIETSIETPVTVGDGASSDVAEVLGTLPVGVAGVTVDARLAFYNRAFARLLGVRADVCVGRALFEVAPALVAARDAARATMTDGRPRAARARVSGVELDVGLSRPASGLLVLEVRAAGTGTLAAAEDDEDGAMHDLAHAMTAVSDSGTLLELLLDEATEQCGADSTLVARFHEEEANFVAAGGSAAPLRGRRVLLVGTVFHEVGLAREPRALERAGVGIDACAEDLLGGPALVAPLVAHDRVLGALVVARDSGAPSFSRREMRRLRLVADHAALALWKAHLAEEADAATEAKNNFLATVSHELRTPLTTLTGYGELLADEILGPMPTPQLEVVERMRAVTHELTGMIDEILTYSSIEAGREIVRSATVSARALLRGAVEASLPGAKQKGLDLCVTDPTADATVTTDAEKVRQILVNLVGNAVKFTDHGCVQLTLTTAPEEVRFSVRDTGPGINEEDQARLFQPFTQLHGGLTRRHGGAGLGLYISQRLARLLGGRIEVESVPGNGSTFTLVLPV